MGLAHGHAAQRSSGRRLAADEPTEVAVKLQRVEAPAKPRRRPSADLKRPEL